MGARLSDQEIARLTAERKVLPENYRALMDLKPKKGHKERELEVLGDNGNQFVVILRQSEINSLDFSIILGYRFPKSNVIFRLRRYNGKSHEHRNRIERDGFYGFHIHSATERYQELGMDEDSFAGLSDRFADIREAIDCLVSDCGFIPPSNDQMQLFSEK